MIVGVWDRRVVSSEFIGIGGGWGNEGGNAWVNEWEGGDMKYVSSFLGRWILDFIGLLVEGVLGLVRGLGMGYFFFVLYFYYFRKFKII